MKTLDSIAKDGERKVRTAVAMTFEGLAYEIDRDALTKAVQTDDEDAWADALGIMDGSLAPLEDALGEDDGRYDAAIAVLLLAGAGLTATTLNFEQSLFAPEVGFWGRSLVGRFAEATARDSATAAIETIRRHRAFGSSPEEIVAAAYRALSLTPHQAASLDAFSAVLADVLQKPRIRVRAGDAVHIPRTAVDRAIKRHDAHLSASQRSALRKLLAKEPSPDTIASMIEREAAAMRSFRLATIARQESYRAVSAGQQAGFEQGIREGHIPATARRYWVTAGDERVRHSHAAVPGLNVGGVRVDETFKTPFGPAMFPPLEINCRCRVSITQA